MDLIQQYANAIRARPVLKLLPVGLREYALQYEQMCLADIRAQTGNPDLTEEKILKSARPTIIEIVADAWPLISPLLLNVLKKYLPAIAMSGTIGAAIATYLTK